MKILRAEGQAESKRIIAEAEAKANKMLTQSLTQEFILNFQEDPHLFRWEMNRKKFGN